MTQIDGDAFREWLVQTQQSLLESARERHEADGPDDPTALRMDGGAANVGLILNVIQNFEVGDWPDTAPRVPIEEIAVEPHEIVRRQGRGTSWEAALSITSEKRQRMYRAIYLILSKLGPKTDHEIRQEMEQRNFAHSWSGLSARRVELERAGWVRDTGEKRPTQFGKMATVWEAVPEDVDGGA